MRAHGTRACYVFGPEPGGDRALGCRCEPCTNANRVYARDRDRASRRPDVIVKPGYIDATEVRAHIRMLRHRGVGLRTIAHRAPASRSELTKLANGQRRRVTPALAERVLLVFPIDARDGAYVDAKTTWRLLDDLIAHGHTRTALARALGSTARTPALQLGRAQVTARHARAVKELHARLMVSELADRRINADRRRLYRVAS